MTISPRRPATKAADTDGSQQRMSAATIPTTAMTTTTAATKAATTAATTAATAAEGTSDGSGRHQRTETAVNNGDSTGNSGEPFATILPTDENEALRQLENMMANINSAEIQKEKTAAAARVAQWLTLMGDSTSTPLYQRYKPIMDLTRAETIISMSQAESALSQIRVRFSFKI